MARRQIALLLGTVVTLAACSDGPGFLQNSQNTGEAATEDTAAPEPAPRSRGVARDIEAPEVFQTSGKGLWDGRPSLGGVWVAHANVKDPERAMIRNTANGQSVVGALFRRERDNPGPPVQVSSDAAEALGMIAGQPADLTVVALRRQEPEPEPEPAPVVAEAEAAETADTPETEQSSIEAVTAGAAAAIAAAEGATPTPGVPEAEAANQAPPPAPAPAPVLTESFVQIGIFNERANADKAAEAMKKAGIASTITQGESSGTPFWRVIAGPTTNDKDQNALLEKVKRLGYKDAYAVLG